MDEMNSTQIEVRIVRLRFDEVAEAASFPTLGGAFAGIEKLLDEVMDADGHEPRSSLLRNVSWIGAPREDYRVVLFIGGQELTLDDLGCAICGASLDSRPGWALTDVDHEAVCPEHSAAAERRAVG